MKHLTIKEIELPYYTRGEERLNTITHGIGAALAAGVFVYGLIVAVRGHKSLAVSSFCIYGLSLILLYTVSTAYHGLPAGGPRKF